MVDRAHTVHCLLHWELSLIHFSVHSRATLEQLKHLFWKTALQNLLVHKIPNYVKTFRLICFHIRLTVEHHNINYEVLHILSIFCQLIGKRSLRYSELLIDVNKIAVPMLQSLVLTVGDKLKAKMCLHCFLQCC